MIGWAIVGRLLLFGAAKMIRRHRYGCGGGWAHHGCGGFARFSHGYGAHGYGGGHEASGGMNGGGHEGWQPGGPPQWILNRVLSRLQTSPSQSREVTSAFEEFTTQIKDLRGKGKRWARGAARSPPF